VAPLGNAWWRIDSVPAAPAISDCTRSSAIAPSSWLSGRNVISVRVACAISDARALIASTSR
jgi:hypothetical protein